LERLEVAYAVNGYNRTSQEYLRELGSLDESGLGQPSVLIANYINSPTNCLADSKYYSVCCVNECEALLSPIEQAIAAPKALPEHIAQVVAKLPSATVEAPRELSATLLRRLDEIAAQHGGRVPVHGRLFAQWMHHAYPRECPFPHVVGSIAPLRAKDWEVKTGERPLLSKAAMRREFQELIEVTDSTPEPEELPWTPDEELLLVAFSPAEAFAVAGSLKAAPRFGDMARLAGHLAKALAALSLSSVVFGAARGSLGPLQRKAASDTFVV